jgi:erythromycin esterase-like protein
MKAVVEYLERVDPEMAKVAAERYGRMMMWAEEPHEYGLEALASGFKGCEKDVMRVLRDLLAKRLEYAAWGKDGEEFHSGEQNARLVKGEFPDLQERADLRETLLLTGGRRRTVLQGHVLRPRRVLESAGHAHV